MSELGPNPAFCRHDDLRLHAHGGSAIATCNLCGARLKPYQAFALVFTWINQIEARLAALELERQGPPE